MRMSRRTLLHSAAIAAPAFVVGGATSRVLGGSEPAHAATEASDCQPGVGRVVYWGQQRVTNTASAQHAPYQSLIPPVPKFLQAGVAAVVAASSTYILALKGGRVHGFGYCECGSGTAWTGDRIWNIPSAATAGVTAIAAAGGSALALRDGGVIAWGQSASIKAVPEAARSGVTAIACRGIALAVKDGGVIQWGNVGAPVPDAAKSGVVAVSVGGHALALKEDGSVVAWGPSESGTAIQVPQEARSGVTAIAAGGGEFDRTSFSLAVKDGKVFGWGGNELGQLSAPEDTDVVAIDAGTVNGMSLTRRGTINVWGLNNNFQTEVPDEICQASAISVNSYACAALI